MVKITRYYTLVGLLGLSALAVAFGYVYQINSRQQIILSGQDEAVQFINLFRNLNWENVEPFVKELTFLDHAGLRQHAITKTIGQAVRTEARGLQILQLNIYTPDGTTIFATESRQLGEKTSLIKRFAPALQGRISSFYRHKDIINSLDGMKLDRHVVYALVPVPDLETNEVKVIIAAVADVTDRFNAARNNQATVFAVIVLACFVNYLLMVVGIGKTNMYVTEQLTENKKLKQLINKRYHYDSITRLPKLHVFYEKLDEAMAKCTKSELLLAVMVVNLERVQKINDTLGYKRGDELLIDASDRLKQCVRKTDQISRLGGDKFVIMINEISTVDEVEEIIDHVRDAISEPFYIAENELFVSPCIGVSMYPFDEDDVDSMIRKANAAMHKARKTGNNTAHFYVQGASLQEASRFSIENLLRHALEREEFELHYQPVVSLNTGAVNSLEALLRWRSPQLGLVSPLNFIPLLEDTGLIKEVGAWVLERACLDAVTWQANGFERLKINVNVSAVQFLQNEILRQADRAIEISGINPHQLQLEITESLLLDGLSDTLKTLDDLSNMGVSLSIDDFGTGYSSLAYLKRLPINTIKIDRAFVKDISTNIDDAAIINAICALSRSLRFKVVVEGVETVDQLLYLRSIGVSAVQGYIFSKPIPVDKVMTFLCQKIQIDQYAKVV